MITNNWSNWQVLAELGIIILGIYLVIRQNKSQKWSRFFIILSILLIIITVTSVYFNLKLIPWFLMAVTFFLTMSMIVVFQPELRRILARLGSRAFSFISEGKDKEFIDSLTDTVRQLGAKRYGGLLAIERKIELKSHLETGIQLDAQFSSELILTIFHPKTELHDGGIILRAGRVVGAGCLFPVSQREISDRSIGLRHRAGIGITEESDSISIMISEESGSISISHAGKLEHDLDLESFHKRLLSLLDLGDENDDGDETQSNSSETTEDNN